MNNTKLNMTHGLTPDKKEILKSYVGIHKSNIDMNKVVEWHRNGKENES